MVKRPQPGKNPVIRTQRRRVIAEKLVKQVPPSKIAEQIGISRQMVNVEIRAPETQAFIRDAFAPYLDVMKQDVPLALQVVHNVMVGQFHTPVDKLRAVKTFGYLMELADGRKSDGNLTDRPQRFAGTMEELLVLYRKTTLETASQTDRA